MRIIAVCTRFPEELHGLVPYLVGEQGDKRIIVIDSDIEGSQKISMEEAASLIGERAVEEAKITA